MPDKTLPPGIKRALDRSKERKSVAPVPGAREARQAIQGYIGMDPSYSVMDPEAQSLASAYRSGEAASVLGDLAGALSPLAMASAAAKANQLPGIAELIAYHGSPHKFKKFDASKIGTGEGAQAYGHGLYFAEAPGVASEYRKQLAGWPKEAKNIVNDVASLGISDDAAREVLSLAASVGKKEFDIDTAAKWLGYRSRELRDLPDAQRKEILLRMSQVETPGSLYKVDIPDEKIAQMLDWDKPLSQQPAYVQEALKSSGLLTEVKDIPKIAAEKIRALADQPGLADWAKRDLLKDASNVEKSPSLKHVAGVLKSMQLSYGISPDSGPFVPVAKDFLNFVKATQMVPDIETGGGALGMLEAVKGGPREAAQALRDAGIPGIRYLDQGSRGTGKGTSNFVVFPGEEESIKMLDINGEPQMAKGGAVHVSNNPDTMRLELLRN